MSYFAIAWDNANGELTNEYMAADMKKLVARITEISMMGGVVQTVLNNKLGFDAHSKYVIDYIMSK
jgi:hypothetical protein